MKAINVYNSELTPVTLVVDHYTDITIQPKSFATIETDARFNSDEFYVADDHDYNYWSQTLTNVDKIEADLILYRRSLI